MRARRELTLLKDVPLRTRRALSPETLYSDSVLVLNGTSLNIDSALLAVNWQCLFSTNADNNYSKWEDSTAHKGSNNIWHWTHVHSTDQCLHSMKLQLSTSASQYQLQAQSVSSYFRLKLNWVLTEYVYVYSITEYYYSCTEKRWILKKSNLISTGLTLLGHLFHEGILINHVAGILADLADCLGLLKERLPLVKGCHWSNFANIQSCDSKFWAVSLFGNFIKTWTIGLDKFWKTRNGTNFKSSLMDLLPLILYDKEGHPQRPDMGRGRGNPTSICRGTLVSRLLMKIFTSLCFFLWCLQWITSNVINYMYIMGNIFVGTGYSNPQMKTIPSNLQQCTHWYIYRFINRLLFIYMQIWYQNTIPGSEEFTF